MNDRDLLVVTGAGGMGEEIARRLGVGRRTLLADISTDALEAVSQRLAGVGLDVATHRLDMADPASIEELGAASERLGGFEQLVHTAGVSPSQATTEQIIAVDLVGTAHLIDVFGRNAAAGCVGVCIASMSGSMIPVEPHVESALSSLPADELAAIEEFDPSSLDPGIAYAMAKRGNQLRVKSNAVEWGRKGARLVSVSPGVIETPMGLEELDSPFGDIMRKMVETSPMGRYGTTQDVASVVEFLVSTGASYITGTDLLLDGGVVALMGL